MDGHGSLAAHKRFEYCKNRLKYRESRQLTAVKVYTIANESRHILVFGVPRINLQTEIKGLFKKYGELKLCTIRTGDYTRKAINENFEIEQFTDIYHVEFMKLENCRRAKKFLDARNFYGGILHISYAPELETFDDIRRKLYQRKREVMFHIEKNKNKT